ncbi:MAG TPA: cytochrome c oxidase subunit II [Acidimicrobiales bacterium]|nr:cytochrome c oxidase subunit II [Acidimicrobiales bacterium]
MSTATPGGGGEVHHFRRMVAVWVVLSVALDLVYAFVLGPHVPPGTMTSTAANQQSDFNVLFIIAVPVVLAVWVYGAYALITWRASRSGPGDPAADARAHSHLGVQIGWIATTTVLVLGLFVFGLVELVVSTGAGGGQGPDPLWTPTSHEVLPVQVIGQQWAFTFRYPTFGGFETHDLVLPDDTTIAFHVTSLDVIHSFWAYQLGVKADANPSEDNIAYTTTQQVGSFTVRCAELCGLWHGAMFNDGRVVPKDQFMVWAQTTERDSAASTKLLPPFSYTYVPDANGADGGYYPDNVDPYSNVETYGAASPGTSG